MSDDFEGVSGWERVNSLSLFRYAYVMNINPVHLSTAGNIEIDGGDVLFPLVDGNNRYYQDKNYFQGERVSRDEIEEEIAFAESEVEDFLETFITPKWVTSEQLDMKQHYDSNINYNIYDVRGNRVRYNPKWGKFISGGKRKSAAVEEGVTVTYSDPDGDGWSELATITFTEEDDLSLYEIKVYFAGYEGSPQYEIRPPMLKSRDGDTVTIEFETWKLIDPTIYNRYPTRDGSRVIDLTDADNLVDTVDVYRKYNDATEDHASIYYVATRNSFDDSVQSGYLKLSDPQLNTVQVIPADYDTDDEEWGIKRISGTLRYIEFNYLSGFRYRPNHGANFWDELHPDLAKIIAYIATARLSRPLAGKPDTVALSQMLQEDLAVGQTGQFRYATDDVLTNPIGTRKGEVYAWRRLMHFQHKFMRYNR